jgi:hypothetical protein
MSDFPDDFGQQSFPSYGIISVEEAFTNIAGSADSEVFHIDGKGILYSAAFDSSDADMLVGSSFTVEIDTKTIFDLTLQQMLDRGLITGVNDILTLACYNTDTPRFTLCVKPGITFYTKFDVVFHNTSANVVTIYYRALFALVA